MKIKAYDKYNKMWIFISFEHDSIYINESNSRGCFGDNRVMFEAVSGDKDSADPSRWSDLEQLEILT